MQEIQKKNGQDKPCGSGEGRRGWRARLGVVLLGLLLLCGCGDDAPSSTRPAQTTKEKALLEACFYGNVELVRELLGEGVDPNIYSDDREPPLHNAIWLGNTEILGLLLEAGANPNAKDRKDDTPLLLALMYGGERFAIVSKLIESGADVRENGLLHAAAAGSPQETVALLVSKGADVTAKAVWNMATPLHCAAERGKKSIVELLLKNGAKKVINQPDESGNTPLHFAAASGRVELVKLLLEEGAEKVVNKADDMGATPLHSAAAGGHEEVVKLLVANGATAGAPILDAALMGDVAKVRAFLAQNDGLAQVKDGNGWTALLWATALGRRDIVKMLLAAKADPNITHKRLSYQTPLYLACSRGNAELVEMLLTGGATVRPDDSKSKRCLHTAAAGGHPKIVRLLVRHGADVNCRDHASPGHASLHRAVFYGNAEVVRVLIDSGANINIQASNGETPLHMAVLEGDMAFVSLLVSHGANPHIKDTTGKTPLDYAVGNGRRDMAELLRERMK